MIKNNPKITVVIPCYNYARYLHECVQSVLNQTLQDFEIVIVNDGSTDNTLEVAERIIREYAHSHSIFLIDQPNSGQPAASRNAGISRAKGEYILPLDADDKIAPTLLERAAAILDNDTGVGVVYTHIQHFGIQHDTWQCGPFDGKAMTRENVLPYCSLYRKDIWKAVGGYRLNIGYEDWDFWLSIYEQGWSGKLIPEPLFLYRKHEGGVLKKDNEKHDLICAEIAMRHPRLFGKSASKRAEKVFFSQKSGIGKRKVLIACDFFWPSVGGLEIIAERLGENLAMRGCHVDVATRAMEGRNTDLYRGMRILSLKTSRSFFRRIPHAKLQLRKLISSGIYDACILMADPLNWVLWSLEGMPASSKTRVIVQPLVNKEGFDSWKGNGKFRSRLKDILMRADAVIALTRDGAEKKFFEEEGIKSVYLPNATEPVAADNDFRSKWNIANDLPLMLHVANLWPVKNHLGLLEILRSMPGEWRLVMIGHPSHDSGYFERVKRQAAKDPRVTLIPGLPSEQVSGALEAADMLLLASHGEVSPVTILEAMSHARPWVATPECGSVKDLAGGIVTPLDSFPDTLKVLLGDSQLCARLGKAGYEHWQACFSWAKVTDGWEELIRTGNLVNSFDTPLSVSDEMTRILETVFGGDKQSVKLESC